MEKPDIHKLQSIASQVRRDIIRQTHAAQSGHPGGSLGCTEYFVALYFELLKHDPKHFEMNARGQDAFFLSNGHISPVWYSVLARSGYFPLSELSTFRDINSRLQGHPTTHEGLPGVRIASGSLGQGLSASVGMAIAKKMDKDDNFVYTLTGDGELQEGQIWEAASFASHHGVDNLIVSVDRNGQQIDGSTKEVQALDPLPDRWSAFGWEVIIDERGNNMQSVINHLELAKSKCGNGKPVVIIMHTDMGHGVDFMSGTHEWHGKAPNDELAEKALSQLEQTLGDY